MNVLIAEDDAASARLLRQAVTEAGYRAEVTGDGYTALQRALLGASAYDLILLDVMLPQCDGLTVCRALRAAGQATPILLLTARDATEDKVAGLDAGADDYLVKPFRIAELLARMRALLRRGKAEKAGTTGIMGESSPAAGDADTLTVGDVTLLRTTRAARRGERTIPLSLTEFRLLEHLMRHAGQVLTRAALLDHVWQYDFGGNDNVLDVYIRYLRSKLDDSASRAPGVSPASKAASSLIHTVRGIGFYFGSRPDDPTSGRSDAGRSGEG